MFNGKESRYSAEQLQAGEEGIIVGFGQSMTPILKSGQPVRVTPVSEETAIKKNDIVFCKVNGHYYLHKVWSVKKWTVPNWKQSRTCKWLDRTKEYFRESN